MRAKARECGEGLSPRSNRRRRGRRAGLVRRFLALDTVKRLIDPISLRRAADRKALQSRVRSRPTSIQGSDHMDRIKIVGGQRLQGSIPISGAKNAALPLHDRLAAHGRPADAQERAEPRRREPAGAHPAQPRRRSRRRRQAVRQGRASRRDVPSHGARHLRYDGAIRARLAHARELLGAGAAACAHGRRQGVAARRMRHRHAAGRPASRGPQGARCRNRDRRRLRHRARAQR